GEHGVPRIPEPSAAGAEAAAEVVGYGVGHEELRVLRPPVRLFGQADLALTERLAVCGARVVLVRFEGRWERILGDEAMRSRPSPARWRRASPVGSHSRRWHAGPVRATGRAGRAVPGDPSAQGTTTRLR